VKPAHKPEWGRDNFVVLSTVRYCLGRRSGISVDCVGWLLSCWDQIDTQNKWRIIEEIQEALDRGCAGDPIDQENWSGFLNKIKA